MLYLFEIRYHVEPNRYRFLEKRFVTNTTDRCEEWLREIYVGHQVILHSVRNLGEYRTDKIYSPSLVDFEDKVDAWKAL